jgi:hypothetical protein
MSSKTRTRKTSSTGTTRPATTLRSVPDPETAATTRTDTEDKLWEVLHANPNGTAADLSVAAKIGKSTAQKILAKWAADGSVTRTAGIVEGGRRAADLWTITDIDADPAEDIDPTSTAQAAPDSPATPDDTDTTATAESEVPPLTDAVLNTAAPVDQGDAAAPEEDDSTATVHEDPDHTDADTTTAAEEKATESPDTDPTAVGAPVTAQPVMKPDAASPSATWPGVWSGRVLHQVAPDNMRRLKAQGRVFGLAECGAACVPASPVRGPSRTYCTTCWPNQKTAQEAQLPSLPKRVPGFVPPRQPARSNPHSPWFTAHDVA